MTELTPDELHAAQKMGLTPEEYAAGKKPKLLAPAEFAAPHWSGAADLARFRIGLLISKGG